MKRLLVIFMLLLAACVPQIDTAPETTELTLNDVLAEFDKLDSELNTSWKEEQIPDNMLPLKKMEPWTSQLLFLRERTTDELLTNLIDARIEMIKSQLAYYLVAKQGEAGSVEMVKSGKEYTVTEEINCEDIPSIKEAARQIQLSHKSHLAFFY